MSSVFNGGNGTAAYTRHTMSAVIAPGRTAVFKAYVEKRTNGNAFAA